MRYILMTLCAAMFVGGCFLTNPPESPRPNAAQIDGSVKVVTENVKTIMEGQLGKQEGIEGIALAAIGALSNTTSKAQAEAITNVVANACNEIRRADGSAKLLGKITGSASKGIAEMSALEYMAYAESTKAVALDNRTKIAKGVELGMDKAEKLIGLAGAGVGGSGLIALATGFIRRGRNVKRKETLLKSTGNVINDFETNNKDAAKELKSMIAKSTSNLPVEASKEFGTG